MIAACRNHHEIVSHLIENGADVEATYRVSPLCRHRYCLLSRVSRRCWFFKALWCFPCTQDGEQTFMTAARDCPADSETHKIMQRIADHGVRAFRADCFWRRRGTVVRWRTAINTAIWLESQK
jgi:ankyrin repeat protein